MSTSRLIKAGLNIYLMNNGILKFSELSNKPHIKELIIQTQRISKVKNPAKMWQSEPLIKFENLPCCNNRQIWKSWAPGSILLPFVAISQIESQSILLISVDLVFNALRTVICWEGLCAGGDAFCLIDDCWAGSRVRHSEHRAAF